jgi:hypothetical protein
VFSGEPKISIKANYLFLSILVALLTFFLTGFVVHFSMRYGRLAFPPQYNDSNYLTDGLKRADLFMRASLREVYRNYRDDPPHSPMSTLIAATSFIAFGVSETSPYWLSGFILLPTFFGLVLFTLRKTSMTAQVCGLLLAATSPIAFCAVHEFEPDYASALLTLWAIALFVYHLQDNPTARWPLWLSGALFGVALLAKVPFFPFTLALAGSLILLQFHHNWQVGRTGIGVSTRWVELWRFLLPLVLIPLQHYRYGGTKAIQYIVLNMGAGSENWQFASLPERMKFYFTGESGSLYLGPLKWVLISAALVGIIFAIYGPPSRIRSLFLYQVTIAGFIYITLLFLHLKSMAFGVPFGLAFFLCVVTALALVADQAQRVSARFLPKLVWILFIFEFVYRFAPPAELERSKLLSSEEIKFAREVPMQIISRIEARLPEAKTGVVLLTFNGQFLNAQMLEWLALKSNVTRQNREHLEFWTASGNSMPELKEKMCDAEFLLTCDPGVAGVKPETHPTNTRGPQVLEFVRAHGRFKELDTFTAPNGGGFYLFQNAQPKIEQ